MVNHVEALRLCGDLARPFEGLSLTPYHDPVGFPTIGYGHLLLRVRYASLHEFNPIDENEAITLLHQDMEKALQAVLHLVQVPINEAMAASLSDFAFNCGAGNLQASTLLRRLNHGEYNAIPKELNRWVYAAGQKLPGLVRRRQAEGVLWQNA